jgi:ATP-binding cassette subfamily C (CFTR/MRP) protein 1
MVLWMGFEMMNNLFLQYWTTENEDVRDIKSFLLISLLISFGGSVSTLYRNYRMLMGNARVSLEVSYLMSFRLLHASVNSFFDRVPMGRILNRFIKDLSSVDWDLGYGNTFTIYVLFNALFDIAISVYASTLHMLFFVFLYTFLTFKMQRKFMRLNREITRLKGITTSPMVQCFSEGVNGITNIRAFGQQTYSLKQYIASIDEFQKNSVVGDALIRWFQLRLVLCNVLIFIPSIFLNIFFIQSDAGRFSILMRYLIMLLTDISEFMDEYSKTENRFVSFERCIYFANLAPERGYKDLDALEAKLRHSSTPPATKTDNWPSSGRLVIKNLKVKYRPNLNYVLKGISLKIPHGSKVGIVGRTGAGKSTLISCLYSHFDNYEGSIVYDGQEVSQTDLKKLRANITIIPQEPYIFHDSIRNNLDPLRKATDAEVVNMLKDVELWAKLDNELGLEGVIEQGGSNLSQGEKQLLCLARALLQKNKLVLMDEATANIDSQNEQIIQRLLKERFQDCTVLMIAHRLNTIMDCEYILVMDAGLVLEYGKIKELKADPKSHFAQMLSRFDELQDNLK